MRSAFVIGTTIAAILTGTVHASSASQAPIVLPLEAKVLRDYAGVYRWGTNAFVYLQMWDELTAFGDSRLVAFDESGDLRMLYATGS